MLVTVNSPMVGNQYLGNRADWTEDLFFHDLHVIGDVGEDSGLDKVTLVTNTLTTNLNLGALFLTLVNVAGVCQSVCE